MIKNRSESISFYFARDATIMEGRAWLNFENSPRRSICFSWKLFGKSCRLSFSADDSESQVCLSAALPPVAFSVSVDGLPRSIFKALGIDYGTVKNLRDGCFLTERSVSISVHDWSLWWHLWMPDGLWRSDDPKWRRGNFNFIDAIFGKPSLESKRVGEKDVLVPMPERSYKGKVTLEQRKWSRPRWPFKSGPRQIVSDLLCFSLDMEPGGIPIPGKGENSWDCGEDAVFSLDGVGDAVAAVNAMVKSVVRSRLKHGGEEWRPEPVNATGGTA